MKIQFNFAETNELPDGNYEVGFTVVGTTKITTTDLVQASQKSGGMNKIKEQILFELVALLQLDLYGKIIESGGDKNEKEKAKVQTQRPNGPVVDESPVPAIEAKTPHNETGQDS